MVHALRLLLVLFVMLGLAACDKAPSEPAPAVTPPTQAPPTASASAAVAPFTRIPAPARLVAVGDLHGDLDATRAALRIAGAIDQADHWAGKDMMLVQLGDEVDRGDGERAILDLFDRLAAEAKEKGGSVIALNGNHELMNVALDFGNVTPRGLLDFASVPGRDMSDPRLLKVPEAERVRASAFMPGGPVAKQLAKRPIVAVVGDTVFVHGGISPKHLRYGLDRMNRDVQAWMEGRAREVPRLVTSDDGPVWLRRYSAATDPADCQMLRETLSLLQAKRMVVGHTVQRGGISSACGEQVWRIDVGLSKTYQGKPEVLEIAGDKVVALKGPASRP